MYRFVTGAIILCILFSGMGPPSAGAQAEDNTAMTLAETLRATNRNNPAIRAAFNQMGAVRETMVQAQAARLPTLAAETELSSSHIESSNFSAGDGATTKEMSLNLEQPLYQGGRIGAEIERSRHIASAGKAEFIKIQRDIYLDAALAFLDILRDRELLSLRRDNENILAREDKMIRERFDMGDLTRTDTHQAQARLARAQSETMGATASWHRSRARFEQITGVPAPESLSIPTHDFHFPEDAASRMALAVQHNPAIRQRVMEHRASEQGVDISFSAMLPQISAYATYTKEYDPQPGIVPQTQSEMIGIRARIPLFVPGGRSRVREARLQEKRSRSALQETENQIHQNITDSWHTWQAARVETQARARQIEAAKDAANGVREEAQLGQRTILDILDADQELIDARAAMVTATRNEHAAIYTLAHTLGYALVDAEDVYGFPEQARLSGQSR